MSQRGHSIFVGGFRDDATEQEIYNHFRHCGSIKCVDVPNMRHNRKSRGFAFIEYDVKESVERAIKLNETYFQERKIHVERKRECGTEASTRMKENRNKAVK